MDDIHRRFSAYLKALYPISEEDAYALSSEMDPVDIPKWGIVSEQGCTDTSFSIIAEGVVRVYATNNGVESTVGLGSEGDPLFSQLSQHNGGKSLLSVQALTPLKILRISGESYTRLVSTRPALALWAYHMACGQGAALEMRLRHYLGIDAYERYVKFCRDRSNILPYVPVGILAEYLGMTRETMSRCRTRYLKES